MFFGADAGRTGHFSGPGPKTAGRARWKFAHPARATIRNAPAIDGGLLFANYDNDGLYALDLARGKVAWSLRVGTESLSSPIAARGLVFLVGGGALHAIDIETHATRWSVACHRESTSSPLVVGDHVFVGTLDGAVLALDVTTGAERWRHSADEGAQSAIAASGDIVVVGTKRDFQSGHVVALDIATGAQRWRSSTGSMSHSGAPVIAEGTVHALTGLGKRMCALRLDSGAERWRYDTRGALWGVPAIADGIVVFTGDHGVLHALDAKTGREIWKVEPKKAPRATASPAIADGIVYLGAGSELLAYRLKDGAEQFRWKTPYAVTTAPVIADGCLYVGCDQAIIALG